MEERITPEDGMREILGRLRVNGLWEPAGLGLSYVRTGERSVQLTQQHNNPTAAQARIRMRLLLKSIDWEVDESEVNLIDVEHMSPQEQHMREMMVRQEAAQQWPCPKCDTPLSAFPLEEGVWTFDGQEEMILPTGDKEMVEQWSVVIECPVCDTSVPMEPYDYGLLAGDDVMLAYKSDKVIFTALSRPEIIQMMDDKKGQEIIITGTFCPFYGTLLPPHVRGAVVRFEAIGEEE